MQCSWVPVIPTVPLCIVELPGHLFCRDPWWGAEGARVFLQPCVHRFCPGSQSSMEVMSGPQLQSGLLFPLGCIASVLPRPPWSHPIFHGAKES